MGVVFCKTLWYTSFNVREMCGENMEKTSNEQIAFFDNKSFFANGEQVYIQLSTEFPDFVGVTHKHEFIEIIYILSGKAMHTVGEKQYMVKCGDVAVVNSGIEHKFTSVSDSDENFVTYDLMFSPKFFEASAIEMGEFESLKNSFLFYSLFPSEESSQPDMHISSGRFSDYGEIFSRIYQEYRRKEKGYIQLIRAYIISLIIKIFRDIERSDSIHLSSSKLKTVYSAIEYIENNYNTKLSVDDIASKAFLAPDYFRKVFKKVTGHSVTTYMQNLRIDEACKLLSTTETPIKDICSMVGYNDMTTFYQSFKKITGKTPNEYRKS